MTKTRKDNSMTDHIGAIYSKNNNKLLWLIELGVNYDENKIWKLRDWSYRCSPYEKPSWFVITDPNQVRFVTKTRYDWVRLKPKMKLSYHD